MMMPSRRALRSTWIKKLKSRPCPLCDSRDTVAVSEQMQFGLDLPTVICTVCSMVYTNPVPNESVYETFYREAYDRVYCRIAAPLDLKAEKKEPGEVARLLDIVAAFRPLEGATIVEIGPGRGRLAWWARARGANVIAIEPCVEFAAGLRDAGITTLNDTLMSLDPAAVGAADVVVIRHVLEHFLDPNEALIRIRGFLRDNGVLVVEVPNILEPYRSLDRYFLRYVHPSSFSPLTLEALLAKNGFGVQAAMACSAGVHSPQNILAVATKMTQACWVRTERRDEHLRVLAVLSSYRRRWRTRGAIQFRVSLLLAETKRLSRRMKRRLRLVLHHFTERVRAARRQRTRTPSTPVADDRAVGPRK